MAKTPTGEMIELHFDDEFVVERLPRHGALRAPTAQAARSFAGKAVGKVFTLSLKRLNSRVANPHR